MARKKMNPNKFRGKVISVRTNIEEFEAINNKAKKFGLSASELLRRLALNYPVISKVDQLAFLELTKSRADLGRLGGLLKMLLGRTVIAENEIKGLLSEIYSRQDEIIGLAKKLAKFV